MNHRTVTLGTLGNGAAIELFEAELQKVLDNIIDPNTQAKAVREVTLKVKIKPDEEREIATVEIHATGKLAPISPFPTQMFIGRKDGKAIAVEHNPKQIRMFDEPPKDDGKVIPMERKENQ